MRGRKADGVVVARMSIDDMVGRDPRITVLAKLLGWSRRETLGCLVGEVWPITYDQRTHLISERVIDAAAGHEGFAAAMIEADLAARDRSGKVRVGGAKERVEYLNHKTRAGRQGGIKSAESRNKDPKQTPSTGGSTPQARGNPPVPDPSPASAPDPVPDRERGAPATYDPENPEQRGALRNQTWIQLSRARVTIAAELGLTGVHPLTTITPAANPRGYRDLGDRIREEGVDAPAVCARVLEALIAQAREKREVEWLSEKAFSEGGWRTAKESVPKWRTSKPMKFGSHEEAVSPLMLAFADGGAP